MICFTNFYRQNRPSAQCVDFLHFLKNPHQNPHGAKTAQENHCSPALFLHLWLREISEVVRNIRKLFKRQRMGLLRGNLHAVDGAVDLLCNHRADVMAVIRGVVDFVRTRTVACHHPSDLVHVLAEGLVLNGFQQPLSEQRRYIRWDDSLILHRGLNAAHAMQDTALIVDRKIDAVLVCDGSRSVRILISGRQPGILNFLKQCGDGSIPCALGSMR